MKHVLYQKVPINHIRVLNHFLKQHKQNTAGRGDLNYWVKAHHEIIGCARLISVEPDQTDTQNLWLRGVYVKPEARHQGIASQLLKFMHQDLKHSLGSGYQTQIECYAFPHSHLEGFYQALGYSLCEHSALPKSLKMSYQQALDHGKSWLSMSRSIVE
ncbi:MAG: GNAT family N-acetyltransferase [Thiomicrorhabdus chilensis]|uniref:GNAT family N-acetyltransferase n=1 Tax=Thiomicrorhabdus chilensis TaxID=63656 RepID=UPI00299DC55D|nr:GNAT family N-acetyltransferase [Thiomicrorhabdus chilensis]MDX1346617.1 GNAT family N-acetyltransferase [Thiomicrorhabdus chilensis]